MFSFSKHLSGVYPGHRKNTMQSETRAMGVPKTVEIIVAQHIGAPCLPTVKVGDEVKVGQIIADSDKFVSAPIHSSVSGKVKSIGDFTTAQGAFVKSIVIESDGLQTVSEEVKPPQVENREDFIKAIRASGLVGLGGAGFPTAVKFSIGDKKVDTIVVNVAECEPYITSDYRTCLEDTDNIFSGIELVKKYVGAENVILGIEDNKPDVIRLFTERAAKIPGVRVQSLSSKYPQGAEKVLVYHTTGRVISEGKLPLDLGVIVMNVSTAAFIGNYFKTGMPLVEKKITVDGDAVANPQNVKAPIGTPIADIIEFCGGYKGQVRKILMGGPMMGIAVPDDSLPLLKNNNAILAFAKDCIPEEPETACIHCGKCVEACPFSLMPRAVEVAVKNQNVESLRKLKVNLCMECGCCAFTCPAKRDLVTANRLGKKMLSQAKK